MDRDILLDGYSKLLEYTNAETAATGVRRAEPGLNDFLLFARHLATYELLNEYLGRTVLEVGCFIGYGSDALTRAGHEVTAIDLDEAALAFASARSAAKFVKADAAEMPFEDGSFDSVLGLQVLEHLDAGSAERFIRECFRVLKDKGTLVLATPNRAFRLMPGQKPFNPEHTRELTGPQFQSLLAPCFRNVDLKGVRAGEWLEEAEKKRVGRGAVRAYLLNPASRLVKKVLPQVGKRGRAPVASGLSLDEFFATAPEVSISDFRLVDQVDKRAMELVAIGRKA